MDHGRWQPAVHLYERALPVHVQAEPLYRALMAAQLRGGETTLALQTFAACEAALQHALGVLPSAATQALAQVARQQR